MHSVAEALAIILEHTRTLPPAAEPLGSVAPGRVLAENVAADLDSPPYDKALMDGFAVRCADCGGPPVTLRVVEEIAAGSSPTRALGPGEAARIMTGAPIPEGADAVVPVERTEPRADGTVVIPGKAPRPGENILRRGAEMRAGEVVLEAGTVLRPQEFGLLAGVGRDSAAVYPVPRVSILATGSELVEANTVPAGAQIRNSNGPMLVAQTLRAGAAPRYLGIARDDRAALRALVRDGLEGAAVLILSGGVSVGSYDLVPDVLREEGVAAHFHKVAMKPGKPLLFGTRGETLVFGLPGNPVSSFVCFELFVRPAVGKLRGLRRPGPGELRLPLAEDFSYRSDRPTYYPAAVEAAEVGLRVRPVPWFGSADLRGLTRADALVVLPPGESRLRAGEPVSVMQLGER
ncbi:MAG TPA: gephyrin-like molybdotransferase Glp [Gemmataceae bacterium]